MIDKTKLPCLNVSNERNLRQEIWDDSVTSQVATTHSITFEGGLDAPEPTVRSYLKNENPAWFENYFMNKYGLTQVQINKVDKAIEFTYIELNKDDEWPVNNPAPDPFPDRLHVHLFPTVEEYNAVSEDNEAVFVCIQRKEGGLVEKTSGPALG